MPDTNSSINLVPETEFETSVWGKFLKWAVSTGRYIIILTELVIILAFLSRFKLDSDISQLNSEIKGRVNVLDASWPAEQRFRQIQNKTEAAKSLLNAQMGIGKIINELTSAVPTDINTETLEINREEVILTGLAVEEKAIGALVSNLSHNQQWKSISLDKISQDQKAGITFSIKITTR